MLRTCSECGETFETKSSRRKFCYKQHFRTCVVCGKEFPVTVSQLNSDVRTCSSACRRVSIQRASQERKPKFACTCIICGKQFYSKHPSSKVCPEGHIVNCSYCGKPFLATPQQILSGKLTCSKECRYKLSAQSYQSSSGSSNADGYSAMLKKYRESCLNSLGVDNPRKSEDVRSKARSTSQERYGTDSFSKTDLFLEKCRETNQKRYGVDWAAQTEQHKLRVKETCLKKYGVDNPSKSELAISKLMSDPSCLRNLVSFKQSPKEFIAQHFSEKPTLLQLADICGVKDSSIGYILDQLNCTDLVAYTYSRMESEVYEFLRSEIPNEEILTNTRKIITPYELDFLVPSKKLAIECNPTITHNSTIPGFGEGDEAKPVSYHKMKSDRCESAELFLFHIFGYEWANKKPIVLSMLRALLGTTPHRVFARNTDVVEVSTADSLKFLSENHRQGAVNSKVRLGLCFQDELVSLMTFNRMRHTIGTGTDDLQDCWELSRFCSKLNTSVVGGASKLLKHFIETYSPKQIRSFSDRAHTTGKLYSTLGFHEIRRSDPGYVWVRLKDDVAYNRVNAQKRNIQRFLNDPTIDLEQSESEIMSSHGFVKVYDSGTITWEWNSPT